MWKVAPCKDKHNLNPINLINFINFINPLNLTGWQILKLAVPNPHFMARFGFSGIFSLCCIFRTLLQLWVVDNFF